MNTQPTSTFELTHDQYHKLVCDYRTVVAETEHIGRYFYEKLFLEHVESAAQDAPSTERNSLFGFELSLRDYIKVLSRPGARVWKVFFGYNDGTTKFIRDGKETTVSKGFKLILQGLDIEGKINMTPPILLLTSIYRQPTEFTNCNGAHTENLRIDVAGLASAFSGHQHFLGGAGFDHTSGEHVPSLLRQNWMCAWRNLMLEQSVPRRILTIEYGYNQGTGTPHNEPLRGYNFNFMTFIRALTPRSDRSFETGENFELDSKIRFLLVNETLEVEQAEASIERNEQRRHDGIIGIMIAAFAYPDTPFYDTPTSYTFNFSAPCPPTCVGDLDDECPEI